MTTMKTKTVLIASLIIVLLIIFVPVWNIHTFSGIEIGEGKGARVLNDEELNINFIVSRYPRYNQDIPGFEIFTHYYLEVSWEVRWSFRIENVSEGVIAHISYVKDCVWYTEDFCLIGKYTGYPCKEMNKVWLQGSGLPCCDWGCEEQKKEEQLRIKLENCLAENGEYQRWKSNYASYGFFQICKFDVDSFGYLTAQIQIDRGIYQPLAGDIIGRGTWKELVEHLSQFATRFDEALP